MSVVQVLAGFTPGRCRTCHAPIMWARTLNGRVLPFDGTTPPVALRAAPELGPGGGTVLTIDTTQNPTHWQTCPDAAQWRRGVRP